MDNKLNKSRLLNLLISGIGFVMLIIILGEVTGGFSSESLEKLYPWLLLSLVIKIVDNTIRINHLEKSCNVKHSEESKRRF